MPEQPVTLTPVPGAEVRTDDNGNPIIVVATCGTCGRSWNDAAISGLTPVPSARCPFEHLHEYPDDELQSAMDAGGAEGEFVGEHTEDISHKLNPYLYVTMDVRTEPLADDDMAASCVVRSLDEIADALLQASIVARIGGHATADALVQDIAEAWSD